MTVEEDKSVAPLIWTTKQLVSLRRILILFAVVLLVRLACNPAFIDDPQPQVPARANDLADRLDPNVCSWEDLAAISGLGEKRARAIVAYRERWTAQHPGIPAFSNPSDLRNIKGIGPATAANLAPYLIFPNQAKHHQ